MASIGFRSRTRAHAKWLEPTKCKHSATGWPWRARLPGEDSFFVCSFLILTVLFAGRSEFTCEFTPRGQRRRARRASGYAEGRQVPVTSTTPSVKRKGWGFFALVAMKSTCSRAASFRRSFAPSAPVPAYTTV